MEIAYPITCGESKAILLWKKFVCPGINVKCVKVIVFSMLKPNLGLLVLKGCEFRASFLSSTISVLFIYLFIFYFVAIVLMCHNRKNKNFGLGVVAHACNPSTLGGQDGRTA